MSDLARLALSAAKKIQEEAQKLGIPPAEGLRAKSEQVLSLSLVRGTRGYIESVVNQANGCYESGCYDACAVMIRRLVETLIIEAFEHHAIDHKIKDLNGDFVHLSELIDRTVGEKTWNLGRTTKRALPRLKNIGDWSAHNRRFVAHRSDIDRIVDDLRIVAQEMVFLAGMK